MGLGTGFPRSASSDLLPQRSGLCRDEGGFVIEGHTHPRGLHWSFADIPQDQRHVRFALANSTGQRNTF
jgi:hypothetical protein